MLEGNFLQSRCSFGSTDLGHYTMRAAAFLYLFLGIWFCHLVTQPFARIRWQWRTTLSFSGVLFVATFTTMVAVAVSPMSCYSHPNGRSSMRGYPAVICKMGEHTYMLAIGMGLFALSIGAASALCWFVWKAPTLSRGSLYALLFVVSNYRAESWYWGVVRICRSVLLAMTQVAFPSDGVAQSFCFSLILLTTGMMQGILWPWKSPIMNWADAAMTVCFIMIIFSSTIPSQKDAHQSDVSGILMLAMTWTMIAATAACGARLIISFVRPRRKLSTSAFVDAWLTVSGNLSKQTPDALLAVFNEIAAYDVITLTNALAILTMCGLSDGTSMRFSRSLRSRPCMALRPRIQISSQTVLDPAVDSSECLHI